jgi:hypothetical protein
MRLLVLFAGLLCITLATAHAMDDENMVGRWRTVLGVVTEYRVVGNRHYKLTAADVKQIKALVAARPDILKPVRQIDLNRYNHWEVSSGPLPQDVGRGNAVTVSKHHGQWVIDGPVDVIIHERDQIPYSLKAYRQGCADAEKDARHGNLALEAWGEACWHTDPLNIYLKKRYHIDVRCVGTDEIDNQISGHARGYNEISMAEIKRLYGANFFSRVQREVHEHATH